MTRELAEGHVRSLAAETLRHVQDSLRATFGQDIRVSPIYSRDKGRPGYIVFFTIFNDRRQGEPRVVQKPLEWEGA